MASKVKVLTVKPITWKAAKVPIKETGTAIIGITVDCHVCKNKYTIIATRSKASANVFTTSFMEAFTNLVLSTIIFACISGGNASSCCWITCFTALIVSKAFASLVNDTANTATGLSLPVSFEKLVASTE